MAASSIQDAFLRELALSFSATGNRIVRRLAAIGEADAAEREEIVRDELRGLLHAVMVVFDGGSALADPGLVGISDEWGVDFDRNLHEQCLDFWADGSDGSTAVQRGVEPDAE